MELGSRDYELLLRGGYGYRGRLGYLSPSLVDETKTVQFYRMAPPGITMVRISLGLSAVTVDEINAAIGRAEAATRELIKYDVNAIVIAGSPVAAVGGFGSDEVLVDRVKKISGVPTFAGQAAAIEALRKYDAKKLAMVTPFPDHINALVRDFLQKSGFEVVALESLGIDYLKLTRAPLSATYELGKKCFKSAQNADCIYFPGSPMPVVDNIERLERELNTTVISDLQATIWKALSIFGVKESITGYGKLLREI